MCWPTKTLGLFSHCSVRKLHPYRMNSLQQHLSLFLNTTGFLLKKDIHKNNWAGFFMEKASLVKLDMFSVFLRTLMLVSYKISYILTRFFLFLYKPQTTTKTRHSTLGVEFRAPQLSEASTADVFWGSSRGKWQRWSTLPMALVSIDTGGPFGASFQLPGCFDPFFFFRRFLWFVHHGLKRKSQQTNKKTKKGAQIWELQQV